MTQRIGPPHPPSSEKREKDIPDKDRFKKQLTVEEVGEIDADQRKRKRERAAPREEEGVKKTSREEVSKAYSPYQPEFYSTALQTDLFGRNTPKVQATEKSDFGSPMPSMIPSPSGTIDDEESSRLPSSQDFYRNFETPKEAPRRERPLERERPIEREKTEKEKKAEKEEPAPSEKKEKGKKVKGNWEPESEETKSLKPGKEEFPFLVKEGEKKERKAPKIEVGEAMPEEEAALPAPKEKKVKPFKEVREEKELSAPTFTTPKKEGKKVEKPIPAKKEKEIEEPSFYREKEPREERPRVPKVVSSKEHEREAPVTPEFFSPIYVVTAVTKGKPEKKVTASSEIVTSQTPPQFMPPSLAQSVSVTANQLMPYASPETQNLFAQMVGTITVMTTPPGITETRVVLNSPAFERSVFQGAEILFQRYATAPDSFNITLTGNNAQVNLFNANLPALYSAFQKGKFKFRIGKLEASYESSRPVYRRKESAGGEGERGRKQ